MPTPFSTVQTSTKSHTHTGPTCTRFRLPSITQQYLCFASQSGCQKPLQDDDFVSSLHRKFQCSGLQCEGCWPTVAILRQDQYQTSMERCAIIVENSSLPTAYLQLHLHPRVLKWCHGSILGYKCCLESVETNIFELWSLIASALTTSMFRLGTMSNAITNLLRNCSKISNITEFAIRRNRICGCQYP